MVTAEANAGTDITGFGLLGHLGNIAARIVGRRRPPIGARFVSAVPVFEKVEASCSGPLPGGTKRNLDYAAPSPLCRRPRRAQRLLLAVAQTSGGLLIAVPQERWPAFWPISAALARRRLP